MQQQFKEADSDNILGNPSRVWLDDILCSNARLQRISSSVQKCKFCKNDPREEQTNKCILQLKVRYWDTNNAQTWPYCVLTHARMVLVPNLTRGKHYKNKIPAYKYHTQMVFSTLEHPNAKVSTAHHNWTEYSYEL